MLHHDPTFAHAYPSAARHAKRRASDRVRSVLQRLAGTLLVVLAVVLLPTLAR
jgi:hypothetical protein